MVPSAPRGAPESSGGHTLSQEKYQPHNTNGHMTTASLYSTADMSPLVVETRGLHKAYFGRVTVPVLHGINLQIRAREFVALMGSSGSGKSTLLNLLGGLDIPTDGTVLINGVDIATLSEDELAILRNEEVGFVFQFHYLLDEFTCLENALMPIYVRYGNATEVQRARVVDLLRRVGLEDHLHKRPDEMSGGQNQRCALVRALANAPQLVLADEPTGNLDRHSGEEVLALMRELNREHGVAFVIITHDERVARAADRILLLTDGVLQELATGAQRL
jgi:lipoprotein-releasing system ATP-binding protein